MAIINMDRYELPIITSAGGSEHNPPYQVYSGERQSHPESLERLITIVNALDEAGFRNFINVTVLGEMPYVEQVHSSKYLHFLEEASKESKVMGKPLFPSSHSYGGSSRPGNFDAKFGYYISDTYAPIMANTYEVALDSAACAVAGADFLLEGEKAVYVLTRPPGHHAGREFGGGYCYINNVAVATEYLLGHGAKKVAILDFDYHHGNGTQDIFRERPHVLVVDIHADPSYEYPGFSGYEDEKGSLPFPAGTTEEDYDKLVKKGLELIRGFKPDFLVVSAGFDTYKGDPTHSVPGASNLTTEYYQKLGREITSLGIPVLSVQEGGYNTEALGANVVSYLTGLTD